MSERSESNGGGGDRTRVSSDDIPLISNDLRQRIQRLAALWLQLPVADEHDLARIVPIAESWLSLTEPVKSQIESLTQDQIVADSRCPVKEQV